MFRLSRIGIASELEGFATNSPTPEVRNLFDLLSRLLSVTKEYSNLPFMTTTLASPMKEGDLKQFEKLADELYAKMIKGLFEADRCLPETWDDV